MQKKLSKEKRKEIYNSILDSTYRYVLAIVGWEIGKWLFF